jgi:hypothetical protein
LLVDVVSIGGGAKRGKDDGKKSLSSSHMPCVVAVREVEGYHLVAGSRQVLEALECLEREFVFFAALVQGA